MSDKEASEIVMDETVASETVANETPADDSVASAATASETTATAPAANEPAAKPVELGENAANEESPSSLETIASEPIAGVRNGVQAVSKDKTKIDLLLKATGNAPIMKQKKWSVNQDYCIGRISEFIRKYLKLEANEKLFLYVNQTFAPAPDQVVKNLYDCYGADGKLILHYCKSQAWG